LTLVASSLITNEEATSMVYQHIKVSNTKSFDTCDQTNKSKPTMIGSQLVIRDENDNCCDYLVGAKALNLLP
jgi:hypothetical protein